MASFGPQVKNMVQVGAGGEERKPLRREKGRYGVHRSNSLSRQSRPACSHHRPVPFRTQGSAKAFPVKSCRPPPRATPSRLFMTIGQPLAVRPGVQ